MTCSISTCDRPIHNRARALCSLHYQRWWKHGDPLMDARRLNTGRPSNAPEALWDRVQIGGPDECWPWLGGTSRGYGRISIAGRTYSTHRLAYQLANGRAPGRRVVRHACDNPPCCNPAHLLLGTVADNNHDMHARERWCDRKGSRHPLAVLDEAAVAEIRRRVAGGETQVSLAQEFGVSGSRVNALVRHPDKYWSHV